MNPRTTLRMVGGEVPPLGRVSLSVKSDVKLESQVEFIWEAF